MTGFLEQLLGGMNDARQDNRNALMMAGAGLLSGNNWQSGLANMGQGMLAGRQMDALARDKQAKVAGRNRSVDYAVNQWGMSQPEAEAMIAEGGFWNEMKSRRAQAQKSDQSNRTAKFIAQKHGMPYENALIIAQSDQVGEYLKPQKPQQRRIVKGQDGYNYFEDGERVLPNVQAPQEQRQYPTALTSPEAQKAYDKASGKGVADQQLSDMANVEGAISFLGKLDRMKNQLGQMNDDDFGPIQSMPIYNMLPGRDDNRARQQQFASNLSNLELDVAKMKLKGQGTVTDTERGIAKETIGGLGSSDLATQERILDERKLEAIDHIERGLKIGTVSPEQLAAQGIDFNALQAEKERILSQTMLPEKEMRVPEGVDKGIWEHMTPEERKLWAL